MIHNLWRRKQYLETRPSKTAGMYAVVGCNKCNTMWLLSNPRHAKTATCPRCQKQHQTKKLKHFFESDDRAAAQEARAALLAKKHGDSEAFADVAHTAELERLVEDAGVDDHEYLTESGLDADTITEAGEMRTSRSRSRKEIVQDAIETASDRPTAAEIHEYAADHGVPKSASEKILEGLVRAGDVSETGGRYRLL